jgi:hypothetical protein
VEQELSVRGADGEAIDMSRLIDQLRFDGRRLDPGDPHAVRGRWGGVVTADGAEAEIATPPAPLVPGATTRLRRSLLAGEAALRAALEEALPAFALEGYSTHISIEVADQRTVRCARAVVAHFAPALMLMTDRRTSPGLLVRPRRHRVEVCGEHVDGDDLAAAVVFASAVVVAVDERLRRARPPKLVPPRVRLRAEASRERFGWYVDRRAFGTDLYEGARTAGLIVGRRRMSAGDHLSAAWAAVRPIAMRQSEPSEVALVDDRVSARTLLPCERPAPSPPPAL